MEERESILIANLVEIIRKNQDDLYNEEFARYLEEKAGITPEELVEWDRRFSFWQEPRHIPTGLYTLHKRPSFTGKGTNAQSYSWFVWDFSSDKQVIKVI